MSNEGLAQDYLREPGSTETEVDLWEGKPIAPYGINVRELWVGFTDGADSRRFMAASLIWLLVQMQEAFDRAMKLSHQSVESSWYLAGRAIMTRCAKANRENARADVFAWMNWKDEKGRPDARKLDEVEKLAFYILSRADQNEPEAAQEEAATGKAKSTKRKKSHRTRSK